ncbi:MAG: ABC transporter permease [bacterium]|nr:ABC transporter permease [bacterium]
MLRFVVRRLVIMVPLLLFISVVTFIVIQLPPGDYLTTFYISNLRDSGLELDEAQVQSLVAQFGFDRPLHEQYFRWITNILRGNLGWSFQWNSSVNDVLAGRLPITIALSLVSLIFVWIIAIPIAVISATRQYSIFDYFFTFIGFIGIATPSFLLALVAVWVLYATTGYTVTGLFAKEFLDAPWSWAKLLNMLSNAWLPVLIVGVAGTAGLIRVLRATLLDELRKQYVVTARSKGLTERKLLFKYPIRIAMNPIFSTIGWLLPSLVSGQVIVAIVLNLQTVGPILLRATLAQDMYLAGSIVLILSTLTVIGTFISDLLLAWLDPRIRFS